MGIFLFPCDDTDASQRAFEWTLKTLVHSQQDELHLLHVIPRTKFAASAYSVPAIDVPVSVDRSAYEAMIRKAEEFIVRRFLSHMPSDSQITPIVHIIKSETDTESMGHIICQKAEDIKSTIVVMANHNKSGLTEWLAGSVSQYVMHHCKKPVLIARGI
mmetsp:Transcript_7082/g.12121  ORF Transcript_7082/g.12121 Transcript_7082/m.12121 type:complete len:159 (+) Transcript_7082:51-527(+)|eukprot:CAMPEP_0119106746 /NCGR_PEP_ID=MMETSP1180-20130426/6297_1 /TAXON_ID=3052 ORGANISM="Chlamydomonas cf sp, Strain CCMP681" /NCGR_SAMPLE_ID=MMETSP1180 /ASSEMBLY_ACC=CAM_ASM_000741 /LENGTH=158 /DNA_ID=CAMNT_0007092131 /DNA_START=51 /DNA_END=527 /DNA_ORIENTATION=+